MDISLKDNYDRIRDRIAEACRLSGRRPEDVLLLAISKFHSLAAIETVAGFGQRDFGENYFQEWRRKQDELAADSFPVKAIRWHMTGHLQSRKGHLAAGKFELIHTVDSEKLARNMQNALAEQGGVQRVLIEVNISGEGQKSGVAPAELDKFAEFIFGQFPALRVEGLMGMPPFSVAGEKAAPYFRRLANLRDGLERRLGVKLPQLSMGMTGDFPWAIAEGATIVRVGTGIFGPRSRRADV